MHAAGYVLDHSVVRAVGDRDLDTLTAIDVIDRTGAMALLIPASVLWPELQRPKHREDELLPVDDMLAELGATIIDELTRDRAYDVAHAWRILTTISPAPAAEAQLQLMPHVAACALERAWPILTRAPAPWRAGYPAIELDVI